MNDTKKLFVQQLEELIQALKLLDENPFRIRAYEKAVGVLTETAENLESIAEGKVKLAGVGEGIRTELKEFLKTQSLPGLLQAKKEIPEAVFQFVELPGIGPKKAWQLFSELGLQSIQELEYACRENRLSSLKGFGEKVQEKILESIDEKKKNAHLRRIDEALEEAEAIEEILKKEKIEFKRTGELLRHCEIISELEWIVEDEKKIKNLFEGQTFEITYEDQNCKGFRIKSEGVSKIIWSVSEKNRDFWKRYFSLPRELREKKQFNSILNESDDFPVSTLEEIWIAKKRKFKKSHYQQNLHGGVKGIFHCHTVESDGVDTLEDMVKAAEKFGYQYIGIADHSQSAFYARGLKEDRVLEQKKKIKELQKKVSIKIFHGIESDILQDGSLDYSKEFLKEFDFVVASIHSRFNLSKDQTTERILKALENQYTTMWGHPTGRLLLGRKPIEFDLSKVLKKAAEKNVVIELNANPQRLDMDWRWGDLIEEHKISVCINPDAHSCEGIKDTLYGEWMAEKAMIPATQILNLKSVEEVEKYLWQRKEK